MPEMYILAGCNGAGKTTAGVDILARLRHPVEFVNADIIASQLSPGNPDAAKVLAGRRMLTRVRELVAEGVDLALETTLATRIYIDIIRRAKANGYRIILLFFWLPSPEMARCRVAARVARGGHHIPDELIERRYYRGIKNLLEDYIPLCDRWMLFDNTIQAICIAEGNQQSLRIFDTDTWNRITGQQQNECSEDQPDYSLQNELKEDSILMAIKRANLKMVKQAAENGELLVVFLDGEIRHIPAIDMIPFYS